MKQQIVQNIEQCTKQKKIKIQITVQVKKQHKQITTQQVEMQDIMEMEYSKEQAT